MPTEAWSRVLRESVDKETICAHEHHILKAGDLLGLGSDQVAFGFKDGEIENIGRVDSDLGQDGAHVGVTDIDGALEDHFSTQLGKDIGHDSLKAIGIGAAIVNGRQFGGAQLIKGELSRNTALEEIVVASAIVARLPDSTGGSVVIGQDWGRIGGRYHEQAGLADDG